MSIIRTRKYDTMEIIFIYLESKEFTDVNC
jgi:hypothetical protein